MTNAKPTRVFSSRTSSALQVIERSSTAAVDDKLIENITHATSKILRILQQQDKSGSESIIKRSKLSQALISFLVSTQDTQLHLNIVLILDHIAQVSGNKCSRLIRQGAPHALLRSIAATSRVRPLFEELCLQQHLLLVKLSGKEKKLALKARLCGVIIVTLDVAKMSINNVDLSIPILQVLKIYAHNSSNSASLVKHGAINYVDRLCVLYGKQNSAIFKHTLEFFSQILHSKSNSAKAVNSGSMKKMLELYLYWTDLDKQFKFTSLRKTILLCIKHLVNNETGRRSLIRSEGISVLYETAKQSDECRHEEGSLIHPNGSISSQGTSTVTKNNIDSTAVGKAIDNLAMTCSQIIRRSIPRVCLPIPSLQGPIYFNEPSVDDVIMLQELKDEVDEEEEETESEVLAVPLPLTNIESFLKFFPEIVEYQNTSSVIARLQEFRRDAISKVPQTPSNSQNELSDERSDVGPISVVVKPLHHHHNNHVNGNGGGSENGGDANLTTPKLTPSNHSNSKLSISANFLSPKAVPSNHSIHKPGSTTHSRSTSRDVSSIKQVSSKDTNGSESSNISSISLDSPSPSTSNHLLLTASHTPQPAISLKKFVKVAVPDIYSHRSPLFNEHLYEPIQTVQRTLMLLDIARTVHPDTLINRVAYDMDELVKTDHEIPHALSKVRWDGGLSRCKVLPSVPQVCLEGDTNLGDIHRQLGEDSAAGTVNIPMLKFESRFECGNLRKVIQVRIFEYDLVLNSDIGSQRHHQWFYFEVKNMVADFPYRFNIINCEKGCSSFTQGMQPLLYSTTDALTTGAGWVRTGKRICYYKNNFVRRPNDINDRIYTTVNGKGSGSNQTMYTLTFTICFPHSNDTCYIAYHYPYSYTSLQAHLLELQHIPGVGRILRRQHLCNSLAGNSVDLLTITQFPVSAVHMTTSQLDERDYVVLTARIHPGESNSSWVMKGVIEYLLSENEKAIQLRNNFVFKIIPMLNIDGVVNGSHRCSLLGVDMNRQWINPLPNLFPSLYHTKGLIQLLVALDKRPILYCDFHGHSRKKNVFMYGNITKPTDNATVKLLPTILDIHAPVFSFNNCCFTVEKSRESTARVALWRQYNITRSYTLESTYCGADQGPYKGCQVGTHHLEEMGAKFCEAILIMSSADQPCCLSEDTDDDEDSYYSSDTEGSESDDDDSSA